jgi:hypothetical protein
MQNSGHCKLHLQCRDNIFMDRPLPRFLPLHNPVIINCHIISLLIALSTLWFNTFSDVIHSPRMLVDCNAVCLNTG